MSKELNDRKDSQSQGNRNWFENFDLFGFQSLVIISIIQIGLSKFVLENVKINLVCICIYFSGF